MFTFGIFTTHIPYIAFAVVYAWFLLFGINPPATEELADSGKNISIELPTTNILDASNSSCYYYQADCNITAHLDFEESLFKRKLSYQLSPNSGNWQYLFSKSHFSRPPPSFA